MPDAKLADLTRRYRQRVKEYRYARKRIHVLRAAIKRRRAEIAAKQTGDLGAKAAAWGLRRAGWTESPPGSNDSRFLANWRRALNMGYMKGQPWCGFFCIAAWHYAAGKRLPNDTVYTPAIVARARRGDGFTAVHSSKAKAGDLVVINFPGGSSVADHVELALGPAKGGVIQTVGGNTSPGNSGSQANGGGVFRRSRPVGLIAVVARPK